MKRMVSSLLVLLLAGMSAFGSTDDRERELQRERERFDKTKDPVDRAKIGIRISDLLLENIADSIKQQDYRELDAEIQAYTATIENTHKVLIDSGRNAQKKSGGFKEMEIALRKQVNKLKDYTRMVTIDRREPLEKLQKLATGIQDKLLKALFP